MGPQALPNLMMRSKINLIIFVAFLGSGFFSAVNCDLESGDIFHASDGIGKNLVRIYPRYVKN